MIYPLRALLQWEKVTSDREEDIKDCIETFENQNNTPSFTARWTNRQLTFWRTAEDPTFGSIMIEYEPKDKIADMYSLDTYSWCWRNIRILPEELIRVIQRHFCEKVQPISYKITMLEYGGCEGHDAEITVKSDNWKDD